MISRLIKRNRKSRRKDPLLNELARIRWLERDVVVDYGWRRFAVFEVQGVDTASEIVAEGWANFLNALDCPVQFLIRQRQPNMQAACDYHRARRPEPMQGGRVGQVADSLLDLLAQCERTGLVVNRRFYLIGDDARAVELGALLAQCGFRARRLSGQELWHMYSGCISGMGFGHVQDPYQAVVKPGEIELNHRFLRVYEVSRWPRTINTMFMERLLQTGEELDLSLWLAPLSSRESYSRLFAQKGRFEGSRYQALQRGRMVPPDVEATIEDCSRLLGDVERGLAKLYRTTLTVGVYGRTNEDLRRISDKVTAHFRARMSACRPLRFCMADGFRSLMPALRSGRGEPYLTDTGTVLRLFPFGPPDIDTGAGTLFGIDMRSRAPVMFDRFAFGNNGHQVVIARSGAGKSFYVKLCTFRQGTQGIPQYVIDPEGEFGVLAEAMGGRVLVPGRPGHGLNPFAITYVNEAALSDRLTVLVKLIGVMLQGELDQLRVSAIDGCLSGFYRAERMAAESNGLPPVLGSGGINSLYDYLRSGAEKERGEELAGLLERFVTGSVQYLMAGSNNNIFENEFPITTFNLRHLNDDLKPVATLVCSEAVWGLAVSQRRQRVLVVDEAWTVLKTHTGAAALLEIVRRARKYDLALTCITQDINDFLAEDASAGVVTGHAGITLLNNSETKFVLSQSLTTLPLLAQTLGLSAEATQYLKGVARGQGLLVSEQGNFPIEVVSTPEERLLINDDSWRTHGEQEGDALAELMASFGGA